jgi:hypothetical protein
MDDIWTAMALYHITKNDYHKCFSSTTKSIMNEYVQNEKKIFTADNELLGRALHMKWVLRHAPTLSIGLMNIIDI